MQPNHLACIALLLALGTCSPTKEGGHKAHPWGKGYFPNLPVVTHEGKTVRLYDDLLKDKIVVIDFIYTSCPDMCPLTTARLAQVQNKLGDLMGRKVFFYSISVDPQNDSPERLREFAKAFHTGPGWLFLTGKPEAIRRLRFRLGDRSPSLAEHRQELVIGNDASGEWTRSSALADIEQLAMTIRDMDPAWRNQPRPPGPGGANSAGYVLENQPGSAMFRKLCAPCHTIGVGDRVGPDLRDVTARRTHEWLVRFIMDPRKLWLQRDPTALALVAQYPGAPGTLMPRLGVTSNDAEDLIAYLDTQSARLRPAPTQALGAFEEHSHQQ